MNNFLYFLKDRGSDFIIGRFAGRTSLGLYNVGYDIANLPTTELVAPINRAVFPSYAKIANDLAALRAGFIAVLGAVTLFAIPAGIGIAAIAPLACEVLLGPKWLAAIPVIEILALHGAITALQSNVYAVYLALGRADLPTIITAAYVAVLLPLSALLTYWNGINGAALACLITAAVFAPINYAVLVKKLHLPPRDILAVFWRPVIGCVGMYLSARYVSESLQHHLPAVIALFAAVLAGALVYLLLVSAMWRLAGLPPGAESAVLLRARNLLNARFGAARI